MWIIIIIVVLVVLIAIRKHNEDVAKANEAKASTPKQTSSTSKQPQKVQQQYTKKDYVNDLIKQMPAYAGEWLRASIANKGEAIYEDGLFLYYLNKSVEDKLPYFCEDEEEYEAVTEGYTSGCSPLRGDAASISGMAPFYWKTGKHPSEEKIKYWADILVNMAQSGDKGAQAALCSNWADMLVGKETMNSCKLQYEERLRTEAANGDRYAQLAVGRFLTSDYVEKVEILSRASAQGLTDACYFYAKSVPDLYLWKDENGNLRKDTSDWNLRRRWDQLSESESRELGGLMFSAYLKGSEYANGIYTAECQYNLAQFYDPNEDRAVADGVIKNIHTAISWYEKAANSGSKYAKSSVDFLYKVRSGEVVLR